MNAEHKGIGMTSARTRERLVQRLAEQGIRDPRVLDRIRNVPRHLFVDEALASRAYGPYELRHNGTWLQIAAPSTSHPITPTSANVSVG